MFESDMRSQHFIALGMALLAVGYGLGRYTYGLFVPDIRAALGLSTFTVGLVASVSHLGYIVAILVTVWLVRSLSPRAMMLLGGVSGASGILLLGTAESSVMLAVGAFIASMSPGLVWTIMPDAVAQLFVLREQSNILGWVNSGTGVGVLAAAPVAFFVADWRIAYVIYTALALLVLAWTWWALPRMQLIQSEPSAPLGWAWFIRPSSGPLLALALTVGLVVAVYWTYAVDLITSNAVAAPWLGQLFWFVSGGAGVLGVGIAGLIDRYGLRLVVPVNLVVLAVSLLLLAMFPGSLVAVLVSALCFGVGFITVNGILAIWSVQVYAERPSAGMGIMLVLIAVGQVVGPVVAGAVAEVAGLEMVFYGGAALALLGAVMRPRREQPMWEVPSIA
jgi:predicted MFS family arabinose efflux permease